MRQNISDFWLDIISGSHVNGHKIYEPHMIDSISDVPGLYAWYLVVNGSNFPDYYKIFKQKKVSVSIQGWLQEAYEGEAASVYSEEDFRDNGVDHNLCEIASLAFSPPVYIGISKKLGTRLKTHLKELTAIYYSKVPSLPSPPPGKTDFDTIVESQHFAQRMGHSIKSHSTLNLSALRIKTLEMPSGYRWQDLQLIEKYLNRTYIPLYGRK